MQTLRFVGAYCAILEFRRAGRLSFKNHQFTFATSSASLPHLTTIVDRSLYINLGNFFGAIFIPIRLKTSILAQDATEILKGNEKQCDQKSEPSTLISFDPTNAIKQVLKRKFCISSHHTHQNR